MYGLKGVFGRDWCAALGIHKTKAGGFRLCGLFLLELFWWRKREAGAFTVAIK